MGIVPIRCTQFHRRNVIGSKLWALLTHLPGYVKYCLAVPSRTSDKIEGHSNRHKISSSSWQPLLRVSWLFQTLSLCFFWSLNPNENLFLVRVCDFLGFLTTKFIIHNLELIFSWCHLALWLFSLIQTTIFVSILNLPFEIPTFLPKH